MHSFIREIQNKLHAAVQQLQLFQVNSSCNFGGVFLFFLVWYFPLYLKADYKLKTIKDTVGQKSI